MHFLGCNMTKIRYYTRVEKAADYKSSTRDTGSKLLISTMHVRRREKQRFGELEKRSLKCNKHTKRNLRKLPSQGKEGKY